jgi:hypothetical protein
MSRLSSGQPVVTPPTNNVYTALAIVGTLLVILGLIVIFVRAKTLFPESGLF